MPPPDPASWSERLAATLARYNEALLRKVAGRLVKPRNFWPVDDLINRCVETLDNPPMLDRRLAELAPASRQLLAVLGHSRQPFWALGNAVELVMALGQADGLAPVFDLLEAGLLYPVLPPAIDSRLSQLSSFEHWLGVAGTAALTVFSPPQVASRAVGVELPLTLNREGEAPAEPSSLPARQEPRPPSVESDGLEWLLRLGVLWQQVKASPLRRTQQGDFFKRDLERLEQDPLLNGPAADRLMDVPDLGFLLAGLAEQVGILYEADGEVRAGALPAEWEEGLNDALEPLYTGLFRLRGWTPLDGWRGAEEMVGNPFPSAYLLCLLLLARLEPGEWARPEEIQSWLLGHHPYWMSESLRPSRQKPWVAAFLLGVAYSLRLVEASKEADGSHRVRLSTTGRWLQGLAEPPASPPVFARTLLVQPNLEILAYRQGLTPGLIARLSRFAQWKNLGAACTLQLEPDTVYRGLEEGETFDSICLALEQHGTRATPPAVLDSLRTWSKKRDRITVFPAAALLEFNSADELNEALARGLPAIRVADNVVVIPSEDRIEFRHFRLTGTRDYALPPERCVTVEPDGVTLTVDLARSDLMLETELPRFADLVDRALPGGKRQYRLTPASLARARESGWGLTNLETWFSQRTGQPVTPAARLLLTGAQLPPPVLRTHLVLHVEVPELADGIVQWPGTRELIEERLGPTAISVAEENLEALRARLAELGVGVQDG
jgi:hypothetical protein